VNNEDAPGIDWTLEADRQMVTNMIIKTADINGPSKRRDLHENWTARISEEFFEQVGLLSLKCLLSYTLMCQNSSNF
jgi:cGMP-inhibited 3',5'-cyclic phosphodiesterase A